MKTFLNKALLIGLLFSYATTNVAVEKTNTHTQTPAAAYFSSARKEVARRANDVTEFVKNIGKRSATAIANHRVATAVAVFVGLAVLDRTVIRSQTGDDVVFQLDFMKKRSYRVLGIKGDPLVRMRDRIYGIFGIKPKTSSHFFKDGRPNGVSYLVPVTGAGVSSGIAEIKPGPSVPSSGARSASKAVNSHSKSGGTSAHAHSASDNPSTTKATGSGDKTAKSPTTKTSNGKKPKE